MNYDFDELAEEYLNAEDERSIYSDICRAHDGRPMVPAEGV